MKNLDSWEILSIFVRRWKLFVISFLLVFALGCLWVFKSSVDSQSLALVQSENMQADKELEQSKKSIKPNAYKLHFGIKNFNNQPIISNQQLHTMFIPDFEYRKKALYVEAYKFGCLLDKELVKRDDLDGENILDFAEYDSRFQAKKESICAMYQCYSTLTHISAIPALYSLSFRAKNLDNAKQCVKDIVSNISNNRSLKTFESQIQQFYLNSKPLATKSQNIDWRLVELDFVSKGLLVYNIEDIEDRPLVQTSTKAKFILVFFSSLILASILVLTREFFAQNWYRIVSKEN